MNTATMCLLERAVADGVVAPTLACDALAVRLALDPAAALARLARLDAIQRAVQAICYANYANALLGVHLTGADVLARWGYL